MQKEIIDKINLLVSMSGTSNNYETLQEELLLLEKKIEIQKDKVRTLKKSVSENTYMKASDRIIDENIKIGIENRLQSCQDDLDSLKEQLTHLLTDEKKGHDEISLLEEEQAHLRSFLEALELKMKTIGSKDKNIFARYETMIDDTTKELKKLEKQLKEKGKEYQDICDQLEKLGSRREDIENKIAKEKMQLEEINALLANPNSYIDQKTKREDEKRIDQMMDELETMERRKLEIITDPSYIAYDAINLIMEEDFASALSKIKELVTIVKSKPFMEYDSTELEELLESKTNERDALAAQVENKAYVDGELTIKETRMNFLKEQRQDIEQMIQELQKKIETIDTVKVAKLSEYVSDAKKSREALRKEILDYQNVVVSNKEFKTPKKEASLRAFLKQKQEELAHLEEYVFAFEKDLENLVIESKELEEIELGKLQKKLQLIHEEEKKIQKDRFFSSSAKNILAIEKDKEEVKKLNDEVKDILNRKHYTQKPEQIYDEIELLLGSIENPLNDLSEKEDSGDYIDLGEYRIDMNSTKEPENVVVQNEEVPAVFEEEKPAIPDPVVLESTMQMEPVLPDAPLEDAPIFEPIFEAPETQEVNDIPTVIPNRFKVVRVEPLNEIEDKIESLEPKEDEYISFNSLFEGGNKDENSN